MPSGTLSAELLRAFFVQAQSLNDFTHFYVSLVVSFSTNPELNSMKSSLSIEKLSLFLGGLFSLPAGRKHFEDFAIIAAS